MKILKTFLMTIGPLLVISILTSCDLYVYESHRCFTPPTHGFFQTLDDFNHGDKFRITKDNYWDYDNSDFTLLIDCRDESGVSNWLNLEAVCTVAEIREELDDMHNEYTRILKVKECGSIKTDPITMMMCVESFGKWQRNPVDWVVESIVDAQGGDISSHPDWACMVDNHYKFYPGGKFEYYPGSERCDDEPSLLGVLDMLSTSFEIIKNPDEEESYSIFIGATGDMFDVESIDWGELVINATRNGDNGTITLKPAS